MSKRTRDKIEEADQIASEQQIIKPTESEKNAISKFCALSLKAKKIQSETKDSTKDTKPEIKKLRAQLLKGMKSNSFEIVKINSGNKEIPSYLRLVKNVKEVNITPEVIEEAFENLQEEDITEASEEKPEDGVVNAVLANVRRLIRSFNEQPKLTDSLPRGLKSNEITTADETISNDATSLFLKSTEVLKKEKHKRDILGTLKNDIEKTKQELQPFFENRNLTSQRVNFENTPYNICYRKTVDRPKITLKVLEALIRESLNDTLNSKKKSTKSIDKIFIEKKMDFLTSLQTKIGTIETKEKATLHLRGLKK